MIAKYGAGSSPLAREKARARAGELNRKGRETLMKRYGVANPGQLADHLKKCQQTLEKRYQVSHPAQITESIKHRQEKALLFFQEFTDRVIVHEIQKPSSQKQELFDDPCKVVKFSCSIHGEAELPSETFKWRAKRFLTPCTTCLRPHLVGSASQHELADWIQSLGFNVKENDRSLITPYEIDITIPEKKIGVEYHGLYWHSSADKGEKRQHLMKTEMVEAKGWTLIQIFEDEWLTKKDIVKSVISSKLGVTKRIYARKCQLDLEISPLEEKSFLDEHHLQGSVRSDRRAGLRFEGKLIALASTGRSRFKQNETELLRFCTIKGMTLVGGLSRLLKALNEKDLITYADRRYSVGRGYLAAGFTKITTTSPSYFYTDLAKRYGRMRFQKHKLKAVLSNFDSSKTEMENMLAHGYRIIWDCGTIKFKYR